MSFPVRSAVTPDRVTTTVSQPGEDQFLTLLPTIRSNAHYALRRMPEEAREEAIQDVIASSLAAYRALVRQGRAHDAHPTSLAAYAIAHYRVGRSIARRLNVDDVTSVHCQRRTGVRVESLHHFDVQDHQWEDLLVEDRTATPADIAATRIDFAAWLESLSPRLRSMAEVLATGEETGTVAKLFRVSAGRISQIRRLLMAMWDQFHTDELDESSLVPA